MKKRSKINFKDFKKGDDVIITVFDEDEDELKNISANITKISYEKEILCFEDDTTGYECTFSEIKEIKHKTSDLPEDLYNEAMYMLTKYLMMPVDQEIALYYPQSSQLKGIAHIDKSRKNGYYVEFYPHGSAWVLSTLNNGIIYTETYAGDTSLTSQSLIKHGKLILYKMFHFETHKLLYNFQNCTEEDLKEAQISLGKMFKNLGQVLEKVLQHHSDKKKNETPKHYQKDDGWQNKNGSLSNTIYIFSDSKKTKQINECFFIISGGSYSLYSLYSCCIGIQLALKGCMQGSGDAYMTLIDEENDEISEKIPFSYEVSDELCRMMLTNGFASNIFSKFIQNRERISCNIDFDEGAGNVRISFLLPEVKVVQKYLSR